MIDGSYRFRGYGASVRVDAPEAIPLSQLRSLVAAEVLAEEAQEGPSDLHLTRWNGEYHLVNGQRRYGPYRDVHNALRGVANGVHFLLGKRSPQTFIHAGAVEIDGAAVVFPGRSRYGKSTLVSALIEEGAGYLSDEYAVVSSDGAVFPLSKPIRLRGDEGFEYVTPEPVGTPGGFHCRALILTRYVEGGRWEPVRLTSGQAAFKTLPYALQSSDDPDQVLGAVVGLAREAACYESDRGSDEVTLETIRELMGTDATAQEARV